MKCVIFSVLMGQGLIIPQCLCGKSATITTTIVVYTDNIQQFSFPKVHLLGTYWDGMEQLQYFHSMLRLPMPKGMAMSLSHRNKLSLEGGSSHSLPFPSLPSLPHDGKELCGLSDQGTKQSYINVLLYWAILTFHITYNRVNIPYNTLYNHVTFHLIHTIILHNMLLFLDDGIKDQSGCALMKVTQLDVNNSVCLQAILFYLHKYCYRQEALSHQRPQKVIHIPQKSNFADMLRATQSNQLLLKETHQQPWEGSGNLVASAVSVAVSSVFLLAQARVTCCFPFT